MNVFSFVLVICIVLVLFCLREVMVAMHYWEVTTLKIRSYLSNAIPVYFIGWIKEVKYYYYDYYYILFIFTKITYLIDNYLFGDREKITELPRFRMFFCEFAVESRSSSSDSALWR